MDRDFWQSRWDTGKIGFHEGRPNAFLVAHAALLSGRRRVLVPLSGKSQDLWFLAKQGLSVVGVELVERAARDTFAEAGVPAEEARRGPFLALTGGGVTQVVGDFFQVSPASAGTFDAAFDRAALVAIKPEDRRRYAEVLASVLEPGAVLLLVTFAHGSPVSEGPPFSVPDEEVRGLFSATFELQRLDSAPGKLRGSIPVTETLWLLTRRGAAVEQGTPPGS